MNSTEKKLEAIAESISMKSYFNPNLRTGKVGISYTRVSTKEQQENNGSLETQTKLIIDFASRTQIDVIENFGGKFDSAKTDGRHEFQRMLSFAKKNKKITYILVSNYDRFSRTGSGASKLSEDLRKDYGIIVKSVTQDFDTSTASGRLQENFMHMLNNFDNVMKSDRTKIHTKEVMEKGFWPYVTPLGYDNLKKNQRACFHEYIITEEGKQLKNAFLWKCEGNMTNSDIILKLQARGVGITDKNFRYIISNPFYAGYITGKLLEGRLIKGKHPALIDLKTYLKANEMLSIASNVGIPKVFRHEEVPLKVFMKDAISGVPLTGYATKSNWYYKTKSTAIPVNIKASNLNPLFVKKLQDYEFDPTLKNDLKNLISKESKIKLNASNVDQKLFKKKLTEKSNELDKIEKKYLLDQINKDLYEKHADRIKAEIEELNQDLTGCDFNSSNFSKALEKCLNLSQNVSSTWVLANFEKKRVLQNLVFPEGMWYDKQKGEVRTIKVNSIFQQIPYLQKVVEEKRKGNFDKSCLNSSDVPRTGIEPALPCDNQILSLARLPIPPSRHCCGLQY